jgi:hypothetical protein
MKRNSSPNLLTKSILAIRGKVTLGDYWRAILKMCTLNVDGKLLSVCFPRFNAYADPDHKDAWYALHVIIGVPTIERWMFRVPGRGGSDDRCVNVCVARISLHQLNVEKPDETAGTTYELFCNMTGKALALRWPTMLDGTTYERLQFRRLAHQYAPKVGEAVFMYKDDDIEEDTSENVRLPGGLDDDGEADVILSHILCAYPV